MNLTYLLSCFGKILLMVMDMYVSDSALYQYSLLLLTKGEPKVVEHTHLVHLNVVSVCHKHVNY